jgi:ADP-ribose pyrophosphatase YjhB (NUDIX family)
MSIEKKSPGDDKLIWTTEGRKTVLTTRVFNVEAHTCRSPGGTTGEYFLLTSPDFAIIIPVLEGVPGSTEEHFLMVKQWRHGSKSLSLEFPGGVIERSEDPEAGARRELREETGYEAGRLVKLGTLTANPAIMGNTAHFFAAYNLAPLGHRDLDSDEYLEVVTKTRSEVTRGFGTGGEYHHALMAAALGLFNMRNNR